MLQKWGENRKVATNAKVAMITKVKRMLEYRDDTSFAWPRIFLSLLVILSVAMILFMAIIHPLMVFAQESEQKTEIEKVKEEVLYLEKKLDRDDMDTKISLGAFVAAVLGIPTAAIFHYRNEKGQRQKLEADQKCQRQKLEADLFLRLNQSIYRSDEAKKILDAAVKGKPILKEKGGDIEIRELENFLNEVQAVCILINHGILSQEIAEPGFAWAIQRVKENMEIMNYIEQCQKIYNYYSWAEISMYKIKEYPRATNFKNNGRQLIGAEEIKTIMSPIDAK
jgi:hypothetical protein